MKNKDHIKTPSNQSTDSQTKEERIANARARHEEITKEYLKSQKELNGELHFDKAVTKLSKTLKLDKSSLRKTYEGNKGELVEKFHTRVNTRSNLMTDTFMTTLTSSMTGMFAYLTSMDVNPFSVLLTSLFGAASVTMGIALKQRFNAKSKLDKDLKHAVLEYQNNHKQLPAPK